MTIHIHDHTEAYEDEDDDILVLRLGGTGPDATEVVIDTGDEHPGTPDIRVNDGESITKIVLDDEDYTVEDILQNDLSLLGGK